MPFVPNPCQPHGRKPVKLITDRAKRYRANACPPPGPRQCAFCGSRRNVEVEHVDGSEDHGEPDNLLWACRACNTRKGVVFRNAGFGKLTRQYNPAKASTGAKNLGQWIQAILSIRGQGGSMSLPAAVEMIRATPSSKRSEFAAEIWKRRKERAPEVPF